MADIDADEQLAINGNKDDVEMANLLATITNYVPFDKKNDACGEEVIDQQLHTAQDVEIVDDQGHTSNVNLALNARQSVPGEIFFTDDNEELRIDTRVNYRQ